MKHLPKGQLPNPKQRFLSLQARACSGDWDWMAPDNENAKLLDTRDGFLAT